VSLCHLSLDRSKIRANASKHKAMNHERMLKSEKHLDGEMRVLLRKVELIDAKKDNQYGKINRSDELPKEPQRLASRLQCIRFDLG